VVKVVVALVVVVPQPSLVQEVVMEEPTLEVVAVAVDHIMIQLYSMVVMVVLVSFLSLTQPDKYLKT
jgi:hypothetical protein